MGGESCAVRQCPVLHRAVGVYVGKGVVKWQLCMERR